MKKRKFKNKLRAIFFSKSAAVILIECGLLIGIGLVVFVIPTVFPGKNFVSPLPVIKNSQENKSYATSDTKFELFKKQLIAKNHSFQSAHSVANGYTFILTSGEEIVFSVEKDIDMQLSSLQLILERLTIEGKGLKRLDFRFDKPVITFK